MTDSALIGSLEKPVSVLVGMGTAASMLVGAIVYFASLSPRLTALEDKSLAQISRMEDHNREQDRRLSQIEEGRSIGLQRLSKVEEATAAIKDSLTSLNSKMDRVLMRR